MQSSQLRVPAQDPAHPGAALDEHPAQLLPPGEPQRLPQPPAGLLGVTLRRGDLRLEQARPRPYARRVAVVSRQVRQARQRL